MMNLIKCKKTTTIAVIQSTELSPLFFLEKIYYVMFDEYETWGCSTCTDLECDINQYYLTDNKYHLTLSATDW